MNLPEKKQRWVYHAEVLPQPAGAGVTRRVLAYTDGLKKEPWVLYITTRTPRSPMWCQARLNLPWTARPIPSVQGIPS